MPLRKKVSYVGLKDYSYTVYDTDAISRDFFNIIEFPDKFKAGKNLIKLRANASKLVTNSEIFIEILDYNGNPIYYEPLQYIEKEGTRVVAVYIYEDTSPGDCMVYIAGRAAVNPATNQTIPWEVTTRNTPNVLWSRALTIAPNDRNDVEIIYTNYPNVTVTETVQAYLQPSNVYNVFTQMSASGATVTITPVTNQILNGAFGAPTGPSTTSQGQQSPGTPSFGTQFYDLSVPQNTLSLTSGATTLSPPLNTLNGYSLLTTTGLPLSQSMEGGVFVINDPNINIQALTRGKDNLIYPNSQVTETNANYSASPSQLSGSIKFAIVNVLSSTQAFVSQFAGFKNVNDNTFGPFNITLRKTQTVAIGGGPGGGGGYSLYDVNAIQASSNFTASFIQPTTTILTQNSASFADIILSDIEPATGDVYKVKTLYKPSGFFGDFIDIGDTILEQTDLLVDSNTLETNVVVGSYYENFGRFDNLAEINQYWETSGIGTVTSPFTITYDNDTIIGGARLLANWLPGNTYIAGIGDAGVFNIKQQYRPAITKNTEYIVKFRIANDLTIGSYSSADANIPNARVDVYISGSQIEVQEEFRNSQAGEIILVPNINATLTGVFGDNNALGIRVGTYQVKHTPSAYSNVQFRFKALDNATVDLKFVSRNGSFIIADVQLLADKETGYSPNFVRLNKRIPSEHLNTPLTFKFQYFDYRSNKADLESIAFGAVFDGDNTYIDGVNNLITGSIFLSNQTNTGIELAGVSSGFIRSVGFNGVDAAMAGTGSTAGFLFYSGSVLRNVSNEFVSGGIGFQAMASTSSYIRVSSANNELRIVSPGFDLRTLKGTTQSKLSGSIFFQGLNTFAGADRVLVTTSIGQLFYTSSAALVNTGSFYVASTLLANTFLILYKGDGSYDSIDLSTLTPLSASYATTASFALSGGGGSTFPFTGSARITGSLNVIGTTTITGSLTVSGSSTFTNIGPAIFSGSVNSQGGFTGSLQGTASFATTASFLLGSVTSASYAATASLLTGRLSTYRSFGTGSTVGTGTTSLVATTSFLIPANTFTTGDILRVRYRVRKLATGGNTTTGIYINTTNDISTATTLGILTANTTSMQMKRDFYILAATGINTEHVGVGTSLATDDVATGRAASTINWAVDQYIIFGIAHTNTGDSAYSTMYYLERV